MKNAEKESLWQIRGHQEDTLAVGTIVAVGLGFLGIVFIALLIAALLLRAIVSPRPLVDVEAEWKQTEGVPGVRPNQALERQRYQAGLDQRLSSYGWEDQAHSRAHIPISRAIEIMADRKLQVEWPEPETKIKTKSNTGAKADTGAKAESPAEAKEAGVE
jgi:hypothetical protein